MATDRLGSIVAFVRVAEHGSFAQAARGLGISASAVSKSVARLETRLGVRLLQRTTRSLGLTEDGRLFFDRCRAILREFDEAEQAVRDRAAVPSGVLHVGLPSALGRLKIAPSLALLVQRYPGLRLEASFGDQLADLVAGGLDAVVRIGEPRDSQLVVRRVGTARYIVFAAPASLARRGEPASPDELDRFDCIGRVQPGGANCHATWKFSSPVDGAPFERAVTGVLAFDSNDAIIQATLAGGGLAQLHTYMADPYLKDGTLVQVLAPYAADGPPISVLFPSSRQVAPKVRVFIDHVARLLADEPAT